MDVSEELTAFITRVMMMEAISLSEVSVSIYQTAWHNILKESHTHTHCCENLKFHD
jgi:hypothetical protein